MLANSWNYIRKQGSKRINDHQDQWSLLENKRYKYLTDLLKKFANLEICLSSRRSKEVAENIYEKFNRSLFEKRVFRINVPRLFR